MVAEHCLIWCKTYKVSFKSESFALATFFIGYHIDNVIPYT